MKTVANNIANCDHVIVDFYCREDGKQGGTSLRLEEAMQARRLLVELVELIPAKDYLDLIADLDRSMLAIDQCRLDAFKAGAVTK